MKTIRFKSLSMYWNKEFNGLKPNTVRFFDDVNDIRLEILNEWLINPFHLNIEIENTYSGDIFTRIVRDVTKFEKYYIISWA